MSDKIAAGTIRNARGLFDIPPDVSYLNAAFVAPIPTIVRTAGEVGVRVKAAPWHLTRGSFYEDVERARQAAAGLIGAEAQDIAIVGSASYGIATAGLNLPLERGARVLIIEGEHASASYEWRRLAEERGAVVDVVPRPGDGDWTAAILARIHAPGAPPIGIAALTPVHWTEGGAIELDRIAPDLRAQGAALVVDGTQGVGLLPLDVRRLQPDFLVFPTYKWLLGPYGFGFLYVAPSRQDGRPLEQHGWSRRGADDPSTVYNGDLAFMDGARRFDIGERSNFVALPMALAALDLVAGWGIPALAAHARALTDRIAAGVADWDVEVPSAAFRSPHILGLRFPAGQAAALVDQLSARGVFVSARRDIVRVSPHVYNTEADADRFVAILGEVLRASRRS